MRRRSLTMRPSIPRCGGFSLLEVLIALCILGSSFVVVLGHVNHAVTIYRVARETTVATSIAESMLAEILTSKDPIRTQERSGRVKDDARFEYHVSVTDAALPGFEKDDLKGVLRVEVTVTWDAPTSREVKLVQLTSSDRGTS